MQQDTSSFWSDIQTLENRLTENPESFCFANLAEIYLKVGMVDDALHVARQGVERHPRYLAGQRALAMACHSKGLVEECRTALIELTAALPEELQAMQMLARLHLQAGDNFSATKCFETILEFHPDDSEAAMQLQSLQQVVMTDNEEEFIEELDEADILELEEIETIDDESYQDVSHQYETEISEFQKPAQIVSETKAADPLSTVTLAELYVKQGFIAKALDIYRAVVAENPNNLEIAARIAELENSEKSSLKVMAEPFTKNIIEAAEASKSREEQAEPISEQTATAAEMIAPATIIGQETSAIPATGSADNAIATLNSWLENIRRIRTCR